MSIYRKYYDFGKKNGDYTCVLTTVSFLIKKKPYFVNEKCYKVGTEEEAKLRKDYIEREVMIPWKNVNEELPKEDCEVLVAVQNKKLGDYNVVGWYIHSNELFTFARNSLVPQLHSFNKIDEFKGKYGEATHYAIINKPTGE